MSVLNLLGRPADDLLYCAPWNDLVDVARTLVAKNVNAIAVLDEKEQLVGILTDHDIMKALAHGNGELGQEEVHNWMSNKVITCPTETTLSGTLRLMGKHSIRHLVVTEARHSRTIRVG